MAIGCHYTNADGLPAKFAPHPFTLNLDKADAGASKRPVGKDPLPVKECGQRFFMDFGFMWASAFDYSRPDLKNDRVVTSYDGFNSYLAIVDELSKYFWVFLCRSKDPPTALVSAFLVCFGHPSGGQLRTDQGGELARSEAFRT